MDLRVISMLVLVVSVGTAYGWVIFYLISLVDDRYNGLRTGAGVLAYILAFLAVVILAVSTR